MVRTAAAKEKLLDAAFGLVRTKGYAATSVDDLCKAAGVTKGAFFHHFESKEQLAVAAAERWSTVTGALFETAPYHAPEDPLDRVLAYLEFRRAILEGRPTGEYTCLAGTMVQETWDAYPPIRDACRNAIVSHADTLVADFEEAMERYGVTGVSARSLALHTQVVLQGGFILAKATGDVNAVADSIDHLIRYIRLLFGREENTEGASR